MSILGDYTDNLLESVKKSYSPIPPVTEFDFVTGSDFLNEDPTPFQRVTVKTLYGLWQIYPPDKEEAAFLKLMQDEWHIAVDLECKIPITTLIMALGRRSTKSTLASFLASISAYKLICRGNPQKYYGIRERHPIHVRHVASSGEQAASVFILTSDNIKKVPFMRKYIDFDKDNSTELRLFSPYDLWLNDRIKARNETRLRGTQREKTQIGSILIESITTSARSSRGDAIFMLMFSEFAHFMRAMQDKHGTTMSENPQSDYAMRKALTPSVKDFGIDGKIIYESSPLDKGGEFYDEYCFGGGWEQDNPEDAQEKKEAGYQVIQLSTWQARPSLPKDVFAVDYRRDPIGAAMEFGAHFGNPSGAAIPESLINKVPQEGVAKVRINFGGFHFVISIDAGGAAKRKKADTYALGWAHTEHRTGESTLYYIDGLEGWDAEFKELGNGFVEHVPVDPNTVISFILTLVKDLGGRNFIHEITYDQWNSQQAIAMLQGLGIPALETFFTNQYKALMCGNYIEQLQHESVKMYGIDDGGWIYRWKQEMKFLQQFFSGNTVSYSHPSTGPVQTDDFADVTANLVHRLCLLSDPTTQSIAKGRQQGAYPVIQTRRSVMPVKGPPLHRNPGGPNLTGRK